MLYTFQSVFKDVLIWSSQLTGEPSSHQLTIKKRSFTRVPFRLHQDTSTIFLLIFPFPPTFLTQPILTFVVPSLVKREISCFVVCIILKIPASPPKKHCHGTVMTYFTALYRKILIFLSWPKRLIIYFIWVKIFPLIGLAHCSSEKCSF